VTPVKPVGFLARTRARIKARADSSGATGDERGDTLVELLMTLVVLGLAGVALVAAFGTSILASGEHRQLANVDAVMRSTAESATALLQQQPDPKYLTCGDATYYNSTLNNDLSLKQNLPPGYTFLITNVNYWNGAVFSATCIPTSTSPQLLTLKVSHGSYSDSVGFTIDDRGVVGQQTTQLNQPQITGLTPSATTPGAVTVTFTGSSNAAVGQTYVAEACTDPQMSVGCVSRNAFNSGTDVTGLTSGTKYYVIVVASGSANYSAASSSVAGPASPTIALDAPTSVSLSAVTSTSLAVTFTVSDNAAVGQTYTAMLCTDAGMSVGCVGPTSVTSPTTINGLVAGSKYYATVTASASTGYVAATSSTSSGVTDAVQLSTPMVTNVALASGGLAVSFTGSTNPAVGQTYSATLCTNVGMTVGCVVAVIGSGGVVMGLVGGSSYYATVTANSSAGYLSATSSVTASAVTYVVQLSAPTSVTLGQGTISGSLTVSFNAPANAAAGQAYTTVLCTNSAMTTGCTTAASITSGGQIAGLTAGTTYFATVTATASPGYSAATSSVSSGLAATTQLTAPTSVTLSAGTSNGSLTVTFAPSANAAAGQLYTVTFCTNTLMTTGCVGPTSVTSGISVSGLVAGTVYYATVSASASPNYLASPASSVSTSLNATTQLSAPSSVTLGHGSLAGTLTVNFTPPGNAAVGQTYTTVLCTNSGMTTGCTTAASITSGGQISGLAGGTTYFATVTATASTGYLAATSSVSSGLAATAQLTAPTSVTLSAGTTNGSLTVTFTGSSNAAVGQTYTTLLCTNSGMTTGCVGPTSVTSGASISGLTAGTTYFATVTASASPGYLVSPASTVSTGLKASTQLSAPTAVTLGYGALAGSLTVSFTPPGNAAVGQTYTTVLCTNSAMTTGCTTAAAITSGGQISGLAGGTTYFATVTATASTGYLAATSSASAGLKATTQLSAPTAVTLGYGTVAGSLTVSFTPPGNAAVGQTYTTVLCTNSAMSTGCTTAAAITSGGQVSSLTQGTTYFATVTASASAGYLVSPASSASAGLKATTQLSAPTAVTLGYGTVAGSLTVSFTPPANAAVGQTYTTVLCTNALMSTGCTIAAAITNGGQVTGLAQGTTYFATVTASASAGYLMSPASSASAGLKSTTQLLAPSGVVLTAGTSNGSLTVTFTGSSNAAVGQLYTVTFCTNSGMTTGCVGPSSVTSGASVTGLTGGTTYFATVTAVASAGYLISAASSASAGAALITAPTISSVAPNGGHGHLQVSFNEAGPVTPTSYTATFCTNAAMTTSCITASVSAPASTVTATTLQTSTPYYVTVTAVAPSGYVNNVSSVFGPATSS